MTISVLSSYTGRAIGKDGYYNIRKEDIFLTKTITAQGKRHARNLGLYKFTDEFYPETLEELYPILEELLDEQHSMIVRYKPKGNPERGSLILRRKEELVVVPSNIVAMDIDNLALPKYIDRTDIKAQADYVINLMHKIDPELFPDDLGYIVQGSSSSGLVDTIKLHLWIANNAPLTQGQLKVFFRDFNARYGGEEDLIDMALYSVGQPHYTARPRFIGIDDPFKNKPRMAISIGSDSRIPDHISEVEEVKVCEKARDSYLSQIEGSFTPSAKLESMLDSLAGWDPNRNGARIRVIAIYHSAVQECYDLNDLDKRVFSILKTIRPGQEQDYINQGRQAAINEVFKNSHRDLPDVVLNIPVPKVQAEGDGFYLKLDKLPKPDTALFLKASLGTGKTQNIANLLKDYTGSFLSITNTVALVESNAKRFESGVYNKELDKLHLSTGEINRLCTTIHSLHKLPKTNFDFVFIDECDAVINDLLFASIISEDKKILIKEALSSILINADIVIFSDGDISKETMEAYVDLMKGQKNLQKVEHIKESLGNGVAYKHKSIESLIGAMYGAIETGDKCILVSDLSPLKLNSYYTTFKRIMPEKVGVVMHAHSKADPEFVDIVNNTTEALKRRKVDYLLCSPSITNGVDFNFFDTIFVITTTNNHSPNLRFQALKRERKSNIIHFYLPHLKGYTSGYTMVPESEDWMTRFRRVFALRKERECNQYLNTFNYYLIKSGCKIIVEDEAYSNPQTKEDKLTTLEERALSIYNGESTSRNNDAPEMKKVVEYFIGYEYELEDIEKFLINRVYEKAEYLSKIIKDFWYVLKHGEPSLLLQELYTEKGSLFNYLTGDSIPKPQFTNKTKLEIVEKIFERCGLDDAEEGINNYIKYCHYQGIPVINELQNKEVADL